jgi:hypothetical protein
MSFDHPGGLRRASQEKRCVLALRAGVKRSDRSNGDTFLTRRFSNRTRVWNRIPRPESAIVARGHSTPVWELWKDRGRRPVLLFVWQLTPCRDYLL